MNPPLRGERDREALDRGASLGCDRLHRDRSRAALARGEGGAVRAGADGRHRARDGVRRSLHRPGAARRAGARPAGRADDGRRRSYGLPAPTLATGSPADLCLVDLDAAWTVGEAGYESRSENSCFGGRELRGRVLMTLAGGAVAYRERGLRDPAGGRSRRAQRRAGGSVKLDRARAALVVVDVQEAFRPAVLDFERVAGNVAMLVQGARILGPARARDRAVPEGARAHGAGGGGAPRRRRADREGLLQRGRGGGLPGCAAGGAPRPGAAVRHRGARVREPDGRRPARRRRRGARRAGRGQLAHRRQPRPRAAQDGARRSRRDERRDRAVRAARAAGTPEFKEIQELVK